MRGTALALITASILSLAACGGDDTSSAAGGSGTGGSGGSTGTGGSSGAGTGGSSGASTGGSSGGGQAGTTTGDGSTPMDVRVDMPTGTNDAAVDRPPTMDGPGTDTGSPGDVARDTTSPPDSGQPDTAPPTDGSSGDAPADTAADATGGDGSATMVLTSTGFVEGAMIPADFTCAGTNVSPPLQWTAGPSGTMSYALVFTDRTPGAVLIHSIIYDIPANVTSLPMNVEKVANPSTPAGAKQVRGYDGTTYGYLGPCPGGALHNYEFSVRAIDMAALPGVTTTSMRAQVEPVVTMHTLASGILNGLSNAKKGPINREAP